MPWRIKLGDDPDAPIPGVVYDVCHVLLSVYVALGVSALGGEREGGVRGILFVSGGSWGYAYWSLAGVGYTALSLEVVGDIHFCLWRDFVSRECEYLLL